MGDGKGNGEGKEREPIVLDVLPPMTVNPVTPWSPDPGYTIVTKECNEDRHRECISGLQCACTCHEEKTGFPRDAEVMDGNGTFGTGYDATRP